MTFEIIQADPSNPRHAGAIVSLLDEYARSAEGGGRGLSDFARANLAGELAKRPSAKLVLAFTGDQPAGLAVAFEGFSTFQCRPLLNLHDLIVGEPFRGRGLARKLLAELEAIARSLGCCKLTLEVLEGNAVAQSLYRAFGFQGYELDPALGQALFWEKKLA